MTGYYRRFIQGYAAIAIPLTNLLKKEVFLWDDNAQSSFDELKFRMTQAPILAMPDFNMPFELETDSSKFAIGAILMQKNHPIAFYSKKLSSKMTATCTYVRELFPITEAIAKWRHYLLEREFTLRQIIEVSNIS